eukprot:GHVR01073244.1.p1 GENE.GHVR01073244.1~~GHVR01073244.1.p1  ORF type:complete len:115 (+),score=5.41 GHVR01073244.1:329-673(+)
MSAFKASVLYCFAYISSAIQDYPIVLIILFSQHQFTLQNNNLKIEILFINGRRYAANITDKTIESKKEFDFGKVGQLMDYIYSVRNDPEHLSITADIKIQLIYGDKEPIIFSTE